MQPWRDISKINFLDIFVGKLNNLANREATFEVKSDAICTQPLKKLCKSLEKKRFEITENMLADGDYYIFPAHNRAGEIVHTYLTQEQVRILNTDAEQITEAYGIIDWFIDEKGKIFYLLRHHKLEEDGTLAISYSTTDSEGRKAYTEKWKYVDSEVYRFSNANHIGFGRYRSPASSRGLSAVYGVPLNFGCAEIEKNIFEDLELIRKEFENGKSLIFTDPRNLLRDDETKRYKFAENIIPIQQRAGDKNTSNIDIFSPHLRYSEYYSKLSGDMALYEKQVGTSKGILTENETSYTATATAVKRANSDTLALLDKIRCALDEGNEMTLEADGVFLDVPREMWNYASDYFDPFEDAETQWRRLVEAKNSGAAETEDLIKWLYPNLSEKEISKKTQRIKMSENDVFGSDKDIKKQL